MHRTTGLLAFTDSRTRPGKVLVATSPQLSTRVLTDIRYVDFFHVCIADYVWYQATVVIPVYSSRPGSKS